MLTRIQFARRSPIAAMAFVMLSAVACGNLADEPSATSANVADVPAAGEESPSIRLALPTEPLWQWLGDSGVLADWEAQHGFRIEASHPFRPFTALISGHADIILVDALDVPVFASGLESAPVIIGKYASDRSIAAVKRTNQATDLAGVVEGRIAIESELGSTLLWSLIVDEIHALDFSYGGGDFDFVNATSGIADAVDRGDAEACLCLPDAGASSLSTGILRPLYDGKSASTVYAELIGQPERPLLGRVFLTSREWYQAHPAEVSAFLEMWETAVRNWNANYGAFIVAYPQLLSVQSDEEIAWLTDYVLHNNWIASTVYPTSDDALNYEDAVKKLQAKELIPPDASPPSVITSGPTPEGGS
ncbi:hypothetical protein [Candidatus Poriferisodalis sp.]|uniref:hypothetical protein n=1 Tax=Candidatus Poriferisodalis sp. TaxID=3101277 RepID=UPI003B01EBC8